jgi:hypothetical protein
MIKASTEPDTSDDAMTESRDAERYLQMHRSTGY